MVSVIVPAYNAARWIVPTLRSAQAQTLGDIEIIVVDDGSLDTTAALVRRLAAGDRRIRLIVLTNRGVGAARNAAIAEARGRFIAPLDADDLWDPEKLAEQVACIERAGARTGLVYCWSRRISEAGEVLGSYYPFVVEGEARRAMILRNFVANASVPLMRAEVLRQIGGYLTRREQGGVQGCEDWDLSIRVAEGWEVAVVRRELVGYRQTSAAMSSGIGGMARSFEVVMGRARQRNPDLPGSLFRWAAGHFFSYLVAKSYAAGDWRGCVRAARRSVCADPWMLCNRRLVEMAGKSVVKLVSPHLREHARRAHGQPRQPASQHSTGMAERSMLARIQARRWESVFSKPR